MDKIDKIINRCETKLKFGVGIADRTSYQMDIGKLKQELTTLIQDEKKKAVDDTVREILQLVNKELKKQGIKDNDMTDIVFNYWSERKQNV